MNKRGKLFSYTLTQIVGTHSISRPSTSGCLGVLKDLQIFGICLCFHQILQMSVKVNNSSCVTQCTAHNCLLCVVKVSTPKLKNLSTTVNFTCHTHKRNEARVMKIWTSNQNLFTVHANSYMHHFTVNTATQTYSCWYFVP